MNDIPKTSEAAGTPSNDWEKTAERLFECSAKLERENARLREALEGLVEWGAFGSEGLDDRSIPHYRKDYARAAALLG